MTSHSKVSILIPCYNAERYLRKTIESALAQTWPYKEIVIVDDGSTDRSLNIIEEFASEEVQLFSQSNKGACRARNLAFEKSTGDYIQYLDADDILAPDKISEQLKFIKTGEPDVIFSSQWDYFTDAIDEAVFPDRIIYKDYENPVELLVEMWTNWAMMQTSVWLTPRKLIEEAGPWNESLQINQDGEFFSRVLLRAKQVRYSDSSKMYYRTGISGSVSRSKGNRAKAESLLNSYQLYEANLNALVKDPKVRKALAMNYYSFIYIYYHEYKDLVNQAIKMVNTLDVPPPVGLLGGAGFKKWAPRLGFFNVLRLRRMISSIRNIN